MQSLSLRVLGSAVAVLAFSDRSLVNGVSMSSRFHGFNMPCRIVAFFFHLLLGAFLCAAIVAVPTEQPGALDLFPPNKMIFNVTIDHFRYARPSLKFPLRVFVYENFTRSAGNVHPVFFYCGNEGAVEDFYNNSGGIFEMARDFGAHIVFVEHRYYGRSLPFGNDSFTKEALQFLSVEQALADYAEVIYSLPSLIGCKGSGRNAVASRCDVVLWGGSYGGMLAAWHRFKYPHLSVGAIASGAPGERLTVHPFKL
jgi:hypothetical protein